VGVGFGRGGWSGGLRDKEIGRALEHPLSRIFCAFVLLADDFYEDAVWEFAF